MKFICRFCRQKKAGVIFPQTDYAAGFETDAFNCTNSRFGRHGPIVKCRNCAIVYDDQFLPQSYLDKLYQKNDDTLYFQEQQARKATFHRYLRKIEVLRPNKGTLLDIGTGTGLFVHLAGNSGWHATGLEPNKKASSYAKNNYHLNLINTPFENTDFGNRKFDVITMWDVLEHFFDPVKIIQKVYQLLAKDGLFVFSTVDPQSLFAKMFGTRWPWYMPMHRVFFSKKAALYYLREAGFSEVVFRPHWRYLSLQYLASRTSAVNSQLSSILVKLTKTFRLANYLIPYYANDLYDCYAFK